MRASTADGKDASVFEHRPGCHKRTGPTIVRIGVIERWRFDLPARRLNGWFTVPRVTWCDVRMFTWKCFALIKNISVHFHFIKLNPMLSQIFCNTNSTWQYDIFNWMHECTSNGLHKDAIIRTDVWNDVFSGHNLGVCDVQIKTNHKSAIRWRK